MKVHITEDGVALGKQAGTAAAKQIRETIHLNGNANIILATGTSQFETLNQLISEPDIDWSKVTMFHLDEYIGLPITHPASFRKYLLESFVSKVKKLKASHLIDGEAKAKEECKRLGKLINENAIDVALVVI
jgi:glucosamine-6-phosphate deaminase